MGSVSTSIRGVRFTLYILGHSPWFDLGLVVWKGYRPRVRLVLAGGHASAWFSPFWRGPAPGAQRYQADFYAVVYTKENVAAKALADQISDLPRQRSRPLDVC